MSYKCENGITRPVFLAQLRELALTTRNVQLQLALLKFDAPVSRKRDTKRKGRAKKAVDKQLRGRLAELIKQEEAIDPQVARLSEKM
jgi:hypothetical protein